MESKEQILRKHMIPAIAAINGISLEKAGFNFDNAKDSPLYTAQIWAMQEYAVEYSQQSQQGGWVSVEDMLPEYGSTIDVFTKDEYSRFRIADCKYSRKDMWSMEDSFECLVHTDNGMEWVNITKQVTHWMPLPPAPNSQPITKKDKL